MKISDAVKRAVSLLDKSESPLIDAQVILASILGKDRMYLHLNGNEELKDDIRDLYFKLIERRSEGEPTKYITGHQEFMGLDFFVKKGVLIPRPDTEILVEVVLDKIKNIKNPVIVDVGCGSGAISVSIAKYKKDALVYALDIMDIPLEVAKINAEKNGVEDRVIVMRSDLLSNIPSEIKADVIISNPPYIKNDIIPTLMREVKDFEPFEALSGGEDGLEFYRRITKEARDVLKPEGLIAYEIGWDELIEVEDILKDNGFLNVQGYKDLAGLDRVVTGVWGNNNIAQYL